MALERNTPPEVTDIGLVVRVLGSGAGGAVVVLSTDTPATVGTKTSVTAAAVDTLLLAANANRFGAAIFNDAVNTLFLSISATAASTTSFTIRIAPDGYYELPIRYTGEIRGIWSGGTISGSARMTEWT